MKRYAGIDLSMETPHLCIVDGEGRKVAAQGVDSTPEAIAAALKQYEPIERAVIETGRMTPWVARGCASWASPLCASTRGRRIKA